MVKYEDSSHTYYTGDLRSNHIVYVSVTTLIGEYKEKFDAAKRAKSYAEKNGQTPEYWIAKWNATKEAACANGTALHNREEKALYDSSNQVYNPELINTPYLEFKDGVYPEMKLWSHEYKVAGRADKIIIETIDGIKTLSIDDHKTGKPIDRVSYMYPNGRYKMMFYPLQHLMDCKYIHYSIQLSLYAYMAECMGFKIGTLRLIYHNQVDEPEIIHVNYLRNEVIALLNHYAEKNSK